MPHPAPSLRKRATVCQYSNYVTVTSVRPNRIAGRFRQSGPLSVRQTVVSS